MWFLIENKHVSQFDKSFIKSLCLIDCLQKTEREGVDYIYYFTAQRSLLGPKSEDKVRLEVRVF